MKRKFFVAVLIIIGLTGFSCQNAKTTDVVIYGGTSAGIIAAVQVVKMGKSVMVIEPGNRLGGLSSGGLGATDIGNKNVIGGLSREFYERIAQKYENPDSWKWQKREGYLQKQNLKEGEIPAMWTFEPKEALAVFQDLIKEYNIPVLYNERLNLKDGVVKKDGAIQSIILESGKEVKGKVFIDASYEGDLMAIGGVSFTVGRESNAQYGERLNGVQKKLGIYHQFPEGVSPYVVSGDSTSGLLPNINTNPGEEGSADRRVQAYCFRMTLTDVPENRLTVEKPESYDEQEYELLFRAIEAGYKGPFFIMSMMPNRKTDSNNKGPFSSDYIGQNYDYPEADYKTREDIIKAHEIYQKGLLWTLANHARIPKEIRDEFSKWGLAKDEFQDNDHWTPQLYIREARRMVSDFVMTEHHCTQDSITAEQSIGMGAYTMDSHHMQRYVDENGFVKNEGDVEVGGFGPYPISLRSIIPKKEECSNLLVPVCLSASHIAFGSIRMEPVFMILGQSAATIAALSIDNEKAIRELSYGEIEKRLLGDGQILRVE